MKTTKDHLDEAYARYLSAVKEHTAVLDRNDRIRRWAVAIGILVLFATIVPVFGLVRHPDATWATAVLLAGVLLPFVFGVESWLNRRSDAAFRKAQAADRDYETLKRAHVVMLAIDGILGRDVQ